MKLGLNKIRNQAFWFLDKINGGKIRGFYNEMKTIELMDSESDYVNESQRIAIENLINHAVSTVTFYKKNCYDLSFENFPIINKNIIRNNQDDFISESFNRNELFTMFTSGSTGTPFVCYQNIDKRKRVMAELIYYNEKLGYQVGNKLIFLRSLNERNKKSKFSSFKQNQTLVNVGELDDIQIHSTLKKVEKLSSKGALLMSYASTLDIFRTYFLNNIHKYDFNITGIISGAEMLHDETRVIMEEVFKCKCVSRYSNQENGVIGQDELENNVFFINEAHYYIEVFKFDKDEPVQPGEIGRIVITDLYNYAMPMIRYDTGDIGAITYAYKNGVKKKVIHNFGGRKIDMVYKTDGTILSPHKISVTFWSFNGINQFQFIQIGPLDYKVVLNVKSSFKDENKVAEKLYDLLGENAKISFEYVNDIPALTSGKRKYIMNQWEKK